MPTKRIFDPEGAGYDEETARRFGLKRHQGHMQSRIPEGLAREKGAPEFGGLILKGRQHKTFSKTEAGEKKAGFRIIKRRTGPLKGRVFSVPIPKNPSGAVRRRVQ